MPLAPGQMSYRCLIIEDDTLVAMGLQKELEQLGHQVAGHASDARQAETIFRQTSPDLVLTDIRLGRSGTEEDGLEIARRLFKIRACPVVVISAYSDRELVERATNIGVFGYLVKPIGDGALGAQIGVAVSRFREHMMLLAEKEILAQNLEMRKFVERAKAVLTQRLGLTEPEAHRRLQQESQNRRMSLGDVARKIVESKDFLEEE